MKFYDLKYPFNSLNQYEINSNNLGLSQLFSSETELGSDEKLILSYCIYIYII